MIGSSSVAGGAKHGISVLSHAERAVAQNALDRLNNTKGKPGLHSGLAASSATVFGGVKSGKMGGSSLMHGQGNDTFMGGARSLSTHALANIGNDTVVSGSATGGHKSPEAHGAHSVQNFSLNSDTINVKGATAEGVKGAHPDAAKTSTHTITLSDKTTVTVAGLSHHDLGKIGH
jgi:hypothetical protein